MGVVTKGACLHDSYDGSGNNMFLRMMYYYGGGVRGLKFVKILCSVSGLVCE